MELDNKECEMLFEGITADLTGIIKLDDWRNKEAEIYKKAQQIIPGAQSVIILASEVFKEVVQHFTSKRSVGDLYLSDLAKRNMELVDGYLDWDAYNIIKRLHKLGYKGIPLPAGGAPFDSREIRGVIPFVKLAQMAGIGTIGWHGMLLTPEFGARIRLSALITDAPLPATRAADKYYPCPECNGACIKVCPISAITHPDETKGTTFDRFKCNNMIESSGGCSECLKVCPAGQDGGR